MTQKLPEMQSQQKVKVKIQDQSNSCLPRVMKQMSIPQTVGLCLRNLMGLDATGMGKECTLVMESGLPKDLALDGELWTKRDDFQKTVSIVRR